MRQGWHVLGKDIPCAIPLNSPALMDLEFSPRSLGIESDDLFFQGEGTYKWQCVCTNTLPFIPSHRLILCFQCVSYCKTSNTTESTITHPKCENCSHSKCAQCTQLKDEMEMWPAWFCVWLPYVTTASVWYCVSLLTKAFSAY